MNGDCFTTASVSRLSVRHSSVDVTDTLRGKRFPRLNRQWAADGEDIPVLTVRTGEGSRAVMIKVGG